jgi:hypothetical protein
MMIANFYDTGNDDCYDDDGGAAQQTKAGKVNFLTITAYCSNLFFHIAARPNRPSSKTTILPRGERASNPSTGQHY